MRKKEKNERKKIRKVRRQKIKRLSSDIFEQLYSLPKYYNVLARKWCHRVSPRLNSTSYVASKLIKRILLHRGDLKLSFFLQAVIRYDIKFARSFLSSVQQCVKDIQEFFSSPSWVNIKSMHSYLIGLLRLLKVWLNLFICYKKRGKIMCLIYWLRSRWNQLCIQSRPNF